MHTILGSGGVIGRELSLSLLAHTDRIRQVSRSPEPVNPSDETVCADLLEAEAAQRAVAGSDVAYLVAGLKYDAKVWEEQWPRVMNNVLKACIHHRCRLVFFDNVYAYGLVDGVMTEETPFRPTSRKGEVRAKIATTLLEAMSRGDVEAMIVRSADFYGPGATISLPHATVFSRLRAGKNPQWVADPSVVHSFTYTPDAGRALAVLGQASEAYGQTWHVPTNHEPITPAEFVRIACELAGRPYKLEVAPRWLLRLMSLFVPVLRENQEMMYQFERPYRFDSKKIETAFGLRATDYRTGIAACLGVSQPSVR